MERFLKSHLPPWDKSETILCLGPGDGYELDILSSLGFTSLKGITNDEAEAEKDARLDIGDLHDLPYDGPFRYVYSKETLEHLVAPLLALREMNRVMPVGGEFVHLISCGMEKQRELYHVSCFPDWLWVDLFHKAGFSVDYIYDTQATEIGFVGRKTEDLPLPEPERLSYDLRSVVNGIKRFKITL